MCKELPPADVRAAQRYRLAVGPQHPRDSVLGPDRLDKSKSLGASADRRDRWRPMLFCFCHNNVDGEPPFTRATTPPGGRAPQALEHSVGDICLR